MAKSPDVMIGMRLLDTAKPHGFVFQLLAPGPDGPLWGVRETEDWQDTIYIGGFWTPGSCSAVRRRKSSLLVPGDLLVAERVSGDALNVLNTVVSYWALRPPVGDWPTSTRTPSAGMVVMAAGVSKSPHSAVGWVFLSCPQLSEGGCTIRWRRGDRLAHVLAGRKVGATVADGQVLTRLDVPESGWVDLAELRIRGEVWLRETLARRASAR